MRLATAAYLTGRMNDCVQALQRAYQMHLDGDDTRAAVRCAFWLALVLMTSGESAVGGGWVSRAQRLLEDVPNDVVERGYVLIPVMFRDIFAGEFGPAHKSAVEIADYGRRFDDRDLVAMGRHGAGPARAVRRAGSRGACPAGRGDGEHRNRRGVADLRGPGLLLDDRGLPGDFGFRPGHRVDGCVDEMVR